MTTHNCECALGVRNSRYRRKFRGSASECSDQTRNESRYRFEVRPERSISSYRVQATSFKGRLRNGGNKQIGGKHPDASADRGRGALSTCLRSGQLTGRIISTRTTSDRTMRLSGDGTPAGRSINAQLFDAALVTLPSALIILAMDMVRHRDTVTHTLVWKCARRSTSPNSRARRRNRQGRATKARTLHVHSSCSARRPSAYDAVDGSPPSSQSNHT